MWVSGHTRSLAFYVKLRRKTLPPSCAGQWPGFFLRHGHRAFGLAKMVGPGVLGATVFCLACDGRHRARLSVGCVVVEGWFLPVCGLEAGRIVAVGRLGQLCPVIGGVNGLLARDFWRRCG